MLVLRNHGVIPDPQFGIYSKFIENAAGEKGIKTHFVDDMVYHVWSGQIHCGTNVIRKPDSYHVYPEYLERIRNMQKRFEDLYEKFSSNK
jgi:hypothetical protein